MYVCIYIGFVTEMFRSLIGKVYFSEQGTQDATKEKAMYMYDVFGVIIQD